MVTDFVRPESMEVPEGGLASFLTATVGEWADDEVPQTGIAGLQSVADQLAEYGRHEDTYMVHAAEGETVIPMAVLDENPRLKASLFAQMRSMGIDPERYVVGNELNSINPVTGQPEFFLKGLWKGLKKAVKKVVKVLKKVAPIVLSIGLSMVPGIGPILGTTLGSGIGTLVQGGSLKDALKMAAIGGASAGLFKGIQGSWQGMKPGGAGIVGGFREGVASGMPGAAAAQQAALIEGMTKQQQALMPKSAGPPGTVTPAVATASTPSTVTAQHMGTGFDPATLRGGQAVAAPLEFASNLTDDLAMVKGGINKAALASASGLPPSGAPGFQADVGGTTLTGAQTPGGPPSAVTGGLGALAETAPSQIAPTPGFGASLKDMFDPTSGKTFFEAGKDAFFPSTTPAEEVMRLKLGIGANAPISEVMSKAAEQGMGKLSYTELLSTLGKDSLYQPSMLRKYLPIAGAGMGILGLTGGFEQPEVPPAEDPFGLGGQSAWDLLQANPEKYRIFSQGAPYSVPTGAQGGDVTKCIPHRNTGGTFPPRDGAIAGPGTGTSDDIPAMLSDGEFVMTARAVEGAGNGDRRRGVRKMYEVMRGFEGVA